MMCVPKLPTGPSEGRAASRKVGRLRLKMRPTCSYCTSKESSWFQCVGTLRASKANSVSGVLRHVSMALLCLQYCNFPLAASPTDFKLIPLSFSPEVFVHGFKILTYELTEMQ